MNWDDYRIFLAVARRKKLSLASRDLKLDETTISRRLKQLENRLGQTLFERLRAGHELTTHGEALLAKTEEIERHASSITEAQRGSRQKPSGTLRISVAEGFGVQILSPILTNFCNAYPDIEIDLVSGSGFLSLSKREADVAVGLSKSKSKYIISELLSAYGLHLYAAPHYIQNSTSILSKDDLSNHTFIDYVDDLIYSEELRYFFETLPNIHPVIRSTSIMAQKRLVESGAGLAILPDFLAKDSMTKILSKHISITRHFWFSTHQSVAGLGKVKAFRKFLFSNIITL